MRSKLPKSPAVDKDFPLWLHPSGRWCRKIKGRFHYFGKADDPQAALNKWLNQKDDLLAGRIPRPSGVTGVNLDTLVNSFLTHKENLTQTGELRRSTFDEYCRILKVLIDYFGRHRLATDITPQDFEGLRAHLGKGICVSELGKRIQLVRSVYKYAVDVDLLDKAPKFGTFKRPSVKVLRRQRAERASRMIDPAELRKIIDEADEALRAMILLAANCGFGQTDVSELNASAIDLKGGFINFPRPKTGVMRRCPLWPETIAALKAAIKARPTPGDPADADAVFVTKYGRRWVRYQASTKKPSGIWIDSVNLEFRKLVERLELKRAGVSFYALRHVHRTIADRAGDTRAADIIMGHAKESDMAGRYIEQVSDNRLRKVVDTIHAWLFAKPKNQARKAG